MGATAPKQTFEFQRRGPNSALPGDCQYNDIVVPVWNYGRQLQPRRQGPKLGCHAILSLWLTRSVTPRSLWM